MTINRCEDAPCCGCCGTNLYGGNESSTYYDEPADMQEYDDYCQGYDEACCDWQEEHPESFIHDHDCENFDGAPVERWEVTTPPDVWLTEDSWLDGSYEE